MDADEKHTLSKIGNATENSRLACQIPVNAALDNVVFKILKDDVVLFRSRSRIPDLLASDEFSGI